MPWLAMTKGVVKKLRMWRHDQECGACVKDTDVNFLDDICEGARLESRKRERWDKGRVMVVVVGRGTEECGERERERWSYE